MVSHEEIQELAAGYVLRALEPREAEAFAKHVKSCPECAERLAELTAIEAALPLTVEQIAPPVELRSRVLNAVHREAERGTRRTARRQAQTSTTLSWLWRPLAIGATIVLLLALAGTSARLVQVQDRLDSSQERVSSLYDAVTVLADADQRWEFSGADLAPEARGIVAYSTAYDASMMVVWGLPPQTESQSYVAWKVRDGGREGMGPMRRANDGLWVLTAGDMTGVEGVGITLQDESTGPRDVLEVSLARLPSG